MNTPSWPTQTAPRVGIPWVALRVALLSLSMALTAIQGRAAQDGVPMDRIVAVVDNDVVTQSELDRRVQTVLRKLSAKPGLMPPAELLRRQVLERMVLERLQLQMAERRGIRIDDPTLNETMRKIARRNNLSLEEFRDRLVNSGIDYAEFREQVRNEVIIDKLHERVIDRKVRVSDQEVEDFIASQGGALNSDVEYRIGHILIALPEGATPDEVKAAQDKATEIRERLLEGENFARIATSESDGQTALEGGDLGWRKANQLPSIFTRDIARLDVGDISEPIRSPSGFHIIKLEDRRGQARQVIQQTHARHILIKTSAVVDDDKARATLNSLRQRILNGADFAVLARSNSDDTASAVDGGDLGWSNPGELVPEFEEVMGSLQPGQISEPFRSPYGWHIMEVLARRDYDGTDEVLRAQARQILRARKIEEQTELWERRLRDESYVEYRLDEDTAQES